MDEAKLVVDRLEEQTIRTLFIYFGPPLDTILVKEKEPKKEPKKQPKGLQTLRLTDPGTLHRFLSNMMAL